MGKGLHFALVTTFYPPHHFGGDGMFVRLMAHALVRSGHRVDVITDIDAYRTLTSRLSHNPNPEPEPLGLTVPRLHSRLGPLEYRFRSQQERGRKPQSPR